MDTSSQAVQRCIEGTQAEFAGRLEDARALYRQAWDAASSDFEACVAAHYIAHLQEAPEERLRWNQIALERANAAEQSAVQEFYPSLYLNMGQSYELLGNTAEAQRFYNLAAGLGAKHRYDEEQPKCRK